MPRTPKLSKKNGYWYTRAGDPNGVYFGRVSDVPYTTARRRFGEYLRSLEATRRAEGSPVTVLELSDRFVAWVKENRSDRSYDERKRHLTRFCHFRIDELPIEELSAQEVEADHLRGFLDYVRHEFGCDDFTVDKHATSVKAAFNWATKHPSPVPLLPHGYRPFASVEKYKRPLSPLGESDLLQPDEIAALLKFADADLAAVLENRKPRRRRPEEYRQGSENPYAGFHDMLTSYLHTGARTSELAKCRVRDFSPRLGQIVLGSHKRQRTMRHQVARRITVNDDTREILTRCCQGKSSDAPVFEDPKGRQWTRHVLDRRFAAVRERAEIRKDITIYSFRHLWISEALMAGNDIATVAKMAGTSVDMIERVYGHFTNDHFREAQNRLDLMRKTRADSTKGVE